MNSDNDIQKLNILVLDDEQDLTFLLSTVLEFNRYNVKTENEPAKAIEDLKKQKYDLLITDLKMDEMTGMDVIEAVRDKLELNDLKIIMLTSCDLDHDQMKKLANYNVTYLKKPFLPNEIVQKITSLFA
jgi:DNA-binding response OmpR family regulator